MKDRLKSMQRMLNVRETMQRQAEWKLAECERQAADLRAAQARMYDFLDASPLSGGPLLETMARTARGLSTRIAEADGAKDAQAAKVLEEARKTKLAERRRDDIAKDVRRADEKRDLAEWIERAALGGLDK